MPPTAGVEQCRLHRLPSVFKAFNLVPDSVATLQANAEPVASIEPLKSDKAVFWLEIHRSRYFVSLLLSGACNFIAFALAAGTP